MTTRVSDFVARFFVKDQASVVLQKMKQASLDHANVLHQNSLVLRGYAEELAALQKFIAGGFITDAKLSKEELRMRQSLQGVVSDLTKMSTSARISEGELTRLQARMKNLSLALDDLRSSGHPLYATLGQIEKRVDKITPLLAGMSANVRESSMAVSEAGRSHQFMQDVTDRTRHSMVQMTSATQGLLLGMGALEGNLQHMALSMIFLQFSGVLATSLAFGALTVAVGAAYKGIQAWLKTRKEVHAWNSTLRVMTGNSQAMDLLRDRAKVLTEQMEDMGIVTSKSKDVQKAMELGLATLVNEGFSTDNMEMVRTFIRLLLLYKQTINEDTKELHTWETATEQARESFTRFAQVYRDAGGLPQTLDFIGMGHRTWEDFIRMTDEAARAIAHVNDRDMWNPESVQGYREEIAKLEAALSRVNEMGIDPVTRYTKTEIEARIEQFQNLINRYEGLTKGLEVSIPDDLALPIDTSEANEALNKTTEKVEETKKALLDMLDESGLQSKAMGDALREHVIPNLSETELKAGDIGTAFRMLLNLLEQAEEKAVDVGGELNKVVENSKEMCEALDDAFKRSPTSPTSPQTEEGLESANPGVANEDERNRFQAWLGAVRGRRESDTFDVGGVVLTAFEFWRRYISGTDFERFAQNRSQTNARNGGSVVVNVDMSNSNYADPNAAERVGDAARTGFQDSIYAIRAAGHALPPTDIIT